MLYLPPVVSLLPATYYGHEDFMPHMKERICPIKERNRRHSPHSPPRFAHCLDEQILGISKESFILWPPFTFIIKC